MAEIKINFNDALIQYTATGGETSFVYDFPIFDEDHLVVLRQASVGAATVTMVITTGYTVTGVGAEAGGTIELVTPATATVGEIYTLFRDVPEERVTDFTQAGAFNAATVNRELDLFAMTMQQLRRDLDRAARMDTFDQGAASGMLLPEKTIRASKFAAWDIDGDFIASVVDISGLVVSPFGASLVDDLNADIGRATLEVPGKNRLINGGLEIWQRGTSFALPASTLDTYTADRWVAHSTASASLTISRQAGLQLGTLPQSQYCVRVQRDSGQTGISEVIEQPFPLDEIIKLRGKKVTLSFLTKKGADYSPASDLLQVRLYAGTGTAQPRQFGGTYTGETSPISSDITLTTAVQRFTLTSTVIIPTNTTQLTVLFGGITVGTAGANDWFEIDDIQLEVSQAATPFERTPDDVETSRCQRYFFKTFPQATAPAQNAGRAGVRTATASGTATAKAVQIQIDYPVPMLADPAVTSFNPSAANANIRDLDGAADVTVGVEASSSNDAHCSINNAASVTDQNRHEIHMTAEAEI